ncbi:hypothetical protein RvY_17729 [Ramazzottius varieornatus]|uniref:C3H1-type domain-containing protein n=1 Tax=Ramazzottius varieornatus TaxID=947166 RepID=A0A1D1W3U3_RAMVA|nr:hypothetical protein RvY_17729 [Ramazzottius varieornatus]
MHQPSPRYAPPATTRATLSGGSHATTLHGDHYGSPLTAGEQYGQNLALLAAASPRRHSVATSPAQPQRTNVNSRKPFGSHSSNNFPQRSLNDVFYESDDFTEQCSSGVSSCAISTAGSSPTTHRKVERSRSDSKGPRELLKEQQQENQAQQSPNRYKTELCRAFLEAGHCKYGEKCQFAHGTWDLRTVNRHPKYKTEKCRSFHATGLCAYGPRCHFVHYPDESAQATQQQNLVEQVTSKLSQVRFTADVVKSPSTSPLSSASLVAAAAARTRSISLCAFQAVPEDFTSISDQSFDMGSCGNSLASFSSSPYSTSPASVSPKSGHVFWPDETYGSLPSISASSLYKDFEEAMDPSDQWWPTSSVVHNGLDDM